MLCVPYLSIEKGVTFGFKFVPLNPKSEISSKEKWSEKSFDESKYYQQDDNVGLLTGLRSGVIVIDIDIEEEGKKSGLEIYEKWIKKYGEFNTVTVKTGKGGFHLYFRYNDRFNDWESINGIEIDGVKYNINFRTNGAYVVYPGSVHSNGNLYEWIKKPDQCIITDMPEWLIRQLKPKDVNIEQEIKNNKNYLEIAEINEFLVRGQIGIGNLRISK